MGMFDPNQPSSPQSGGWKGRLLLGLFIAFVGWLMYVSQVQENPVTGKNSMWRCHHHRRSV